MPKLIYLPGGWHTSYRSSPHTEFKPTDDDARSSAEVPASLGRVMVADAPAHYSWADGEPADEPVPVANDGELATARAALVGTLQGVLAANPNGLTVLPAGALTKAAKADKKAAKRAGRQPVAV